MQNEDLLALRRRCVLDGLDRAQTVIPKVAELDGALGERLEVRFRQLATEVRAGFDRMPDPVTTAALIRQGEDLIGETIAFLGGAAARGYDLDDGVTSLALRWLDRLSADSGIPKVGVVIPAPTDYTGMLTQIISFKLPTDGLWALPVAVHEYGHFVASGLQNRGQAAGIPVTVLPVEGILSQMAADADLPRLYWHGHEIFADALATAVTGIAYTEYCLRYRFDPATAHEASRDGTHPSFARRTRIQLAVLDDLAAEDQHGLLAGEVARMRETWRRRLAAAGQPSEPSADALLDPIEAEFLRLLREHPKLRSIRYRDHVIARQLSEPDRPLPSAQPTVAHVLNAAWSARRLAEDGEADDRQRERDRERIATQARAQVEQVLNDA